MFLYSKLLDLKKPIRVGFIGCGKFVSMFLSQFNQLQKIEIDHTHMCVPETAHSLLLQLDTVTNVWTYAPNLTIVDINGKLKNTILGYNFDTEKYTPLSDTYAISLSINFFISSKYFDSNV